ncbi:MAG TPA: RHS repeat-associated core domain-containing protein [Pyrinomonadaceae bacterium]|nr:RHS repeat-associated core domain-containing protein [Pyrinomonadaceae bacterium]
MRFEYDAANRLVAIMPDSGSTPIQTQQFGFGNIRLSLTDYVSNQTTYYDGATEYTEYSGNGALVWTKGYVYMGDKILSSSAPNGSGGETIEYHHPDKLGTRVITNQVAGTSVEQTTLPFGTALGAESSSSGLSSKRFTSYERSARTGLDYAQNRTYDSKQGRFTQVDPIGMKAANLLNPQSLNMYNYVGNDPINRTDPTGLFWGFFKKILRIILLVAIVVALVWIGLHTGQLTWMIKVFSGIAKHLFARIVLGVIKWTAYSIAGTIGFKLATEAISGIKQLATRCNVPNYEGLSISRQQELAERGVSLEQWNKLKNKQRLGYFNIVAAIAAAGLSLVGWLVDWAAGGIQQDRTFFVAGSGASNLVNQVKSSGTFAFDINKGQNHPGYEDSWRHNPFSNSLQMSFDPGTGRKLEADIDLFNPNRTPWASVLHVLTEVVPHTLGKYLGGGTQTNPYSVAFRSSWECK